MNLETKIGNAVLEDYVADLPLVCVRPDKTPEGAGYAGSWRWGAAGCFPDEDQVEEAWGIGLQCGILRRVEDACETTAAEEGKLHNFEAVDFDSDAEKYFPAFLEKVQAENPALLGKLYCEKSPHGFHIIYRVADFNDNKTGNQKLARRPAIPGAFTKKGEPERTPQVLVQTRGTGGFIVVAPTPGYEPLPGFCPDLTALAKITGEERGFLMETARSFDQLPQKEKNRWEGENFRETVKPLRLLNVFRWARVGASADLWRRQLESDGWRFIRSDGLRHHFQRPGKCERGNWSENADAVSANLAKVEGVWLFYNFSTSVAYLDTDRAYSYLAYVKAREEAETGAVDMRELARRLWEERRAETRNTVQATLTRLGLGKYTK